MARLILSGVAEAGKTIISLYNVFFRIVSLTLCRAVINKFGQLKIVEEFFLDISEFVKWNDIIKGKIWNWKGIFSKHLLKITKRDISFSKMWLLKNEIW